jgi:hypothetical protein
LVLTRTLTYSVTDDSTPPTTAVQRSLSIVNANQPPVMTHNTGVSVGRLGTVTIGAGALQATDGDNTTAQIVYKLESVPAAGTLALTGTALAVNGTFTQANVDAGALTYAAPGATGPQSFTFRVSDGTTTVPAAASPPSSFAITVTGSAAPLIQPQINTFTYAQDAAATLIDTTLTLNDIDASGDHIASARIQVSGTGFNKLEDTLGPTGLFPALAPSVTQKITGTIEAATGALLLTGNATVAEYEAALHAVTYENLNPNATGSRTVSIIVTDVSLNVPET